MQDRFHRKIYTKGILTRKRSSGCAWLWAQPGHVTSLCSTSEAVACFVIFGSSFHSSWYRGSDILGVKEEPGARSGFHPLWSVREEQSLEELSPLITGDVALI